MSGHLQELHRVQAGEEVIPAGGGVGGEREVRRKGRRGERELRRENRRGDGKNERDVRRENTRGLYRLQGAAVFLERVKTHDLKSQPNPTPRRENRRGDGKNERDVRRENTRGER